MSNYSYLYKINSYFNDFIIYIIFNSDGSNRELQISMIGKRTDIFLYRKIDFYF